MNNNATDSPLYKKKTNVIQGKLPTNGLSHF